MTPEEPYALQRDRAYAVLAEPTRPDDLPRSHLVVGVIDELGDEWESALARCRQVVVDAPQDPDIRYFGQNDLGCCLFQLGRFDEAELRQGIGRMTEILDAASGARVHR